MGIVSIKVVCGGLLDDGAHSNHFAKESVTAAEGNDVEPCFL